MSLPLAFWDSSALIPLCALTDTDGQADALYAKLWSCRLVDYAS